MKKASSRSHAITPPKFAHQKNQPNPSHSTPTGQLPDLYHLFDIGEIDSWTAGVDWITCTQYRIPDTKSFLKAGKKIVAIESLKGNDEVTWKGQGYYGTRAGGASIGTRPDTYLCTLSSETARNHWKSIGEWATNCSRLDLQTTYLLKKRNVDLFDQIEDHLINKPATQGRPCEVTRIRSSKGGNTIYLGSRKSDLYFRIYDKGVEDKSDESGWRIRFEIEFKRNLAKSYLSKLLKNPLTEITSSDIVSLHYRKHFLQLREPTISQLEVARVDSISNAKKRLAYLSKTVRPIIEKLQRAGYGDEALKILFHDPDERSFKQELEIIPYWRQ
jgi:hypothetical protein